MFGASVWLRETQVFRDGRHTAGRGAVCKEHHYRSLLSRTFRADAKQARGIEALTCGCLVAGIGFEPMTSGL
jgi:hypothetical protein